MLEKIQVRVTGIDFNYSAQGISDVNIRFNSSDPNYEVNMSGRVPATTEEYFSGPNPSDLSSLVKRKLIKRLDETEEESTEE